LIASQVASPLTPDINNNIPANMAMIIACFFFEVIIKTPKKEIKIY